MSKDSKAVTMPAENMAAKPQPTQTENKFPLEKLSKDCFKLFGVDPCVFAGATHGLKGEFTVSEIKSIINTWLKKEVK